MKKINFRLPAAAKGQGLVEMAVTVPILIFMLIGVFEVGWALRGYLVLVNVNRETTRFAVRPGYLDYSIKDPDTVGYEDVLEHAVSSTSDQLPLDYDTNSTLIISHLVVDTGLPCRADDMEKGDCDCDLLANEQPAGKAGYGSYEYNFTYDDLILHPGMPEYEDFYARSFPLSPTVQTRINYEELAYQLARQNNRFNCELLQKSDSATPSANNIVVTEIFYDQPQLFGFPLISNPFTDPVPLYTHTTMRIVAAARSGDNVDTVGPACLAFPFVVKEETINNRGPDNRVDIFDGKNPPGGGGGGGDWGWLAWNPAGDDEQYLIDELQTDGRMSINDYTNAIDPNDHKLSPGDYVASLAGLNTGVNNPVNHTVDDLIGIPIIIPVWDTYDNGIDAYHIVGFARVVIERKEDIDIPGKVIMATYIDDASECTSP